MTNIQNSTQEQWIPIEDFENRFKISNKGQILIIRNNRIASLENKRGYQILRFEVNGKRIRMPIHRLVATHFIPNPENKPQINHINSIRHDNRVENLEWCTAKENIQHSVKTGNFFSEKRNTYIKSTKGIQPRHLVGMKVAGKDNAMSVPVFVFDKNKNYIRSYESQNLCAKDLKRRQSNVHRSISKGTTCAGFFITTDANKFVA